MVTLCPAKDDTRQSDLEGSTCHREASHRCRGVNGRVEGWDGVCEEASSHRGKPLGTTLDRHVRGLI